MKILKVFFVLLLLFIGVSDMQAQTTIDHGRGCMDSRACDFSMCIEPYDSETPGEECLLVEVFSVSPEDLFVRTDSGDYVEFDNSTYGSIVICYNLSVDADVHIDGEILVNCGITYESNHPSFSPPPTCFDGCIVTVDGG